MSSRFFHKASSEGSHLYLEYWSCLMKRDAWQQTMLNQCVTALLELCERDPKENILLECQEFDDECPLINDGEACIMSGEEMSDELSRIPETIRIAFVVHAGTAQKHEMLYLSDGHSNGHIHFFDNMPEASDWLFQ